MYAYCTPLTVAKAMPCGAHPDGGLSGVPEQVLNVPSTLIAH